MRRSLAPAVQPDGAPVSKLSRARNSILPQRQPLAPAAPQQQVTAVAPAHAAALGQKRAAVGVSDDAPRPAKLSRHSLAAAPAPAPAPVATPALVAPPTPQATELSADCVPGYSVAMLQGPHGQMSFEEVRAMNPKYAVVAAKKKAASVAPLQPAQAPRSSLAPSAAATAASSAPSRSHALHVDSSPASGTSSHHPSPTMCTKAAMDDIEAMFKDSSPAVSRTIVGVLTPGSSSGKLSGARGNKVGRASSGVSFASGPAVPFSTRSLTKEIPPMHECAPPASSLAELGGRGRPSPVAFSVFTDDEMQTRNIASAAASIAAAQGARAKNVGSLVFVDPELSESKQDRLPIVATTPVSGLGGGRAVRQALSVRDENDDEEEEEDDAKDEFNASKNYPPLTPIAEVNESDMSHGSSISATPALTASAAAAAALATAQELARQEAEDAAAAAAAAAAGEAGEDSGIVDPFDPVLRVQWVNELSVLSTANVTDLTGSGAAPFNLDALATGSESKLEPGDALLQVMRIQPLPAGFASMPAEEKSLSLVCEDLLEGGEILVRLGGVGELFEQHVGDSVLQRMLGGDPANEGIIRRLLLLPSKTMVYEDVAVVFSPVTSQGTLHALLSLYAARGEKMDERLTTYYCYELLKLVHLLHEHSFLHNDVSPSNVWLRFDEDSGAAGTEWSDVWNADGEKGWSAKGLALGNFGSAVDRTLFASGGSFSCGRSALIKSHPAVEMVQSSLGGGAGGAWTEAPDLVGVCQVAYAMLFGLDSPPMKLVRDPQDGRWTPSRAFSQSAGLQRDVFLPLFDSVLNHPFAQSTQEENLSLLAQLVAHFESALTQKIGDESTASPPIANQLKQLLQKQQLMMLQKK